MSELKEFLKQSNKKDNPILLDELLSNKKFYAVKNKNIREQVWQKITPSDIIRSNNIGINDLFEIVNIRKEKEIHNAVFDVMNNYSEVDEVFCEVAAKLKISKEKSLESVNNVKPILRDITRLSQIKSNKELLKKEPYSVLFNNFCEDFSTVFFSNNGYCSNNGYKKFFNSDFVDEDILEEIHKRIKDKVKDENIYINNVYYELTKILNIPVDYHFIDQLAQAFNCNIKMEFDFYIDKFKSTGHILKAPIILSDFYFANDEDLVKTFLNNKEELKHFLLSKEGTQIVNQLKQSGNQEFLEMINEITPKQQRKVGVKL